LGERVARSDPRFVIPSSRWENFALATWREAATMPPRFEQAMKNDAMAAVVEPCNWDAGGFPLRSSEQPESKSLSVKKGYGGVMKFRVAAVVLLGLVLIASRAHALILLSDDLANRSAHPSVLVAADATYPDGNYVASNAVDGDTTTMWNGGSGYPHYVKVDLGQTYSLSRVDLYSYGPTLGLTFTLYQSVNDQAWSDAYSEDVNWTQIASGYLVTLNSPVSVDFSGQATRYLKYKATDREGGGGDWANVSEIAAYGAVPEPASALLFALGGAVIAAGRNRCRRARLNLAAFTSRSASRFKT